MKYFLILALLASMPAVGFGQDSEAIAAGAAADLQKTLAELSDARRDIEAERIPLARQITELEQNLADRRAELAKSQRSQENQLVELNALKAEAKRQAEEVKYVDSLLSEYARAFRSRLSFIEEPRYKEMFEAVDRAASARPRPRITAP